MVHTIGGVLALTGAIALGPRIGRKFKRDGGGLPPGHNMTLAALGAVILWFGWYGFNPGSTLSAMDFEGIGRIATNTTLAACLGALTGVACVYFRTKKFDVGISINGLLAGLVAITCPCYWVSPTGAVAIGAIAGVIVVLGGRLHRMAPGRRPLWGVRGPRCCRHLGHAEPRALRRRQLRRARSQASPTSAPSRRRS